MKYTTSNVLLNFVCKFYFILKAAADGWNVLYVGGNDFKFYKKLGKKPPPSTPSFIAEYKSPYTEL
jgi:hypothetical protein